MSNYNDFKNKNTKFTGVEGITVPAGTTAERGSTTAQWRYNTDTGFFEGRNTDGSFSSLEPTPTIISTDVTEIDSNAGGNTTIRVTGTNFASGGTVKFIGSDASEITASTSTFVNGSNYDAVVVNSSFDNADEPYDVRYISASGIQATLEDQINVDSAPAWDTASGSIGEIGEGSSINVSATATDADGDTISYSETGGTVLTTNSLTLNSASGAITGTAPTVSGDTTLSFNLRASANSKTSDRAFSINILNANGATEARATEDLSGISYDHTDGTAHKKWVIVNGTARNVYVKTYNDGWYWVCTHTFGGTNTLTTTNSDVLIKAGTYYTTENMQNATTDYLRFSDNSNNYVTSAQGNTFWAMEGTANGYGSDFGSAQVYFHWWAHSGGLGRLHFYGNISSLVPSGVTHGLWRAYDNYATSGIVIYDSSNSAVFTSSGTGFTPTTARFSLGTLSSTGTHGAIRDGNGNTNRMYELWVGHQ